jgi:hypothetical protein
LVLLAEPDWQPIRHTNFFPIIAGIAALPIWTVAILLESGPPDGFSEPSSLAFDEMQDWFFQTLLRQFLLHP